MGTQPGGRGEPAGVGVAGEVAGRGDQLGIQDRAHPGQRLDDLGLRVDVEGRGDLGVEGGDPRPDRQELGGKVGHDAGGDVLPGDDAVLGVGRRQGRDGDPVGAADLLLGQPGTQP